MPTAWRMALSRVTLFGWNWMWLLTAALSADHCHVPNHRKEDSDSYDALMSESPEHHAAIVSWVLPPELRPSSSLPDKLSCDSAPRMGPLYRAPPRLSRDLLLASRQCRHPQHRSWTTVVNERAHPTGKDRDELIKRQQDELAYLRDKLVRAERQRRALERERDRLKRHNERLKLEVDPEIRTGC